MWVRQGPFPSLNELIITYLEAGGKNKTNKILTIMKSRIQWWGALMHFKSIVGKNFMEEPWIVSRISVDGDWGEDTWKKKDQKYGDGKGWSCTG